MLCMHMPKKIHINSPKATPPCSWRACRPSWGTVSFLLPKVPWLLQHIHPWGKVTGTMVLCVALDMLQMT